MHSNIKLIRIELKKRISIISFHYCYITMIKHDNTVEKLNVTTVKLQSNVFKMTNFNTF